VKTPKTTQEFDRLYSLADGSADLYRSAITDALYLHIAGMGWRQVKHGMSDVVSCIWSQMVSYRNCWQDAAVHV
jgi:hypothetical protein